MARSTPLWAVYRRVDRHDRAHLDLAGVVAAEFESQAAALAALLPDAPKYPVLSRALALPGRAPTLTVADLPPVVELPAIESRRSRKRRVYAAAAVAQAHGRAA